MKKLEKNLGDWTSCFLGTWVEEANSSEREKEERTLSISSAFTILEEEHFFMVLRSNDKDMNPRIWAAKGNRFWYSLIGILRVFAIAE